MPTQITHVANKVTYRWTFNQDVQTGTFWDGSPYVINSSGLKVTKVEMITEHGTEGPNRVISDIELGFFGKAGFKGELYINGLMKNPKGMHDYDANGNPRNKNYAFDSRSFGVFEKGWRSFKEIRDPVTKKRTKIPVATNLDSSYPNFSLTKFMEMKSQMESGGVDVTTGDVLVVQWSNFNADASFAWNISRAQGFPYQRIISRSCVLSYGTLFVLNAAPAEVSFRPPVLWPEGQEASRPIYPVSQITSRLPNAATELVANPVPKLKLPDYSNDTSFTTFCYGFPFGGGTNYSQAMPLYSASSNGTISAYGAYYQAPLLNRLITLYSNEINNLSGNQRLQNLKVLVQWGIDAFGSIKSYASTSSGAGQKPCAARPWSIIAGYFLNVDAMRQPETTMMSDTNRLNGYLSARTEGLEDEDGEIEDTSSVVAKMVELYGNPYDADNTKRTAARKRWVALQTSLEALCYYKVVDQVGGLTDYRTLGPTHRRVFSGAGANLQQTTSDIKFAFNSCRYKDALTFSGNFARIQWNVVPVDLKTGWAASHDGKSPTFWYLYIKVVSGSGSGDTLYRIIKSWGDFRNGKAENDTNATGFGFILDKPWQNGQPDQASTFEMITCTEKEVGDIFYLIGPTRFKGMADANISPTTIYGQIAAVPVTKLYGWMKYIETLTGTNADLDKGSVLTHEYVQQIINKSPYRWVDFSTSHDYLGSYPWEVAILSKWYRDPITGDRPSYNRANQAAKIDWSMIPGISYWHGVTIADYRNFPGDFNLDNVVNKVDVKMLVDEWNAGLTGATFDLNKDGNVNLDDLKILIDDYYGKTK